MNKTELAKYQKVLEAKRAALCVSLRDLAAIAIERVADMDEAVASGMERDIAIADKDRDTRHLRLVEDALGRVADGSYGVCLRCEEEIKSKRLDALPWAKYCIACQEAHDRHEFLDGDCVEKRELAEA